MMVLVIWRSFVPSCVNFYCCCMKTENLLHVHVDVGQADDGILAVVDTLVLVAQDSYSS